MQTVFFARAFALDKAGSNNAARIAMIPMTTSNSINVNAPLVFIALFVLRPYPITFA